MWVVVINAGDLLARWSNLKIKSTEHQVVEPPMAPESGEYPARYSCAYVTRSSLLGPILMLCRYFCNPNYDQFIEALPGTYESEADKKYPGIYSGDYLVQRLTSTYS